MLLNKFFEQFMPHGACFLWKFEILLPFVLGELLTSLSYVLISICLSLLLREKSFGSAVTRPVVVVYTIFIFLCGIGHAINIYNIWHGAYRLSSLFSMLTGLASLLAAVSTGYLCALYVKHRIKLKKTVNKLQSKEGDVQNGDHQSS